MKTSTEFKKTLKGLVFRQAHEGFELGTKDLEKDSVLLKAETSIQELGHSESSMSEPILLNKI